jgi:hypothetical protein
MSQNFSEKIYDYLYSDLEFVKFMNFLYSSYDLSKQNLNVIFSDKESIDEYNLYLRIFLSNVEPFIEGLSLLNKRMSNKKISQTTEFEGSIKGHLNMNKFIKNKISKSYPKIYPCIIKEKNFETPENIYIYYYSLIIKEKLVLFIKYISKIAKKTNEAELINGYIDKLDTFLYTEQLKSVSKCATRLKHQYGTKAPIKQYEQIVHRIKKNRIPNSHVYIKLLSWIKSYEDKKYLSTNNNSDILRYNGELFTDKLFEIWILYNIKKTLVDELNYEVEEEYSLMDYKKKYVYKLRDIKGKYLYIYFQKGEDLYWSKHDSTNWFYLKNKNKYLKGIPDITIKIESESNRTKMIMIDAKNKFRNAGQNSEEIYKIIGYYDNFKNSVSKNVIFEDSFVVFRNEEKPFCEFLESCDGKKIMNLSVGLVDNCILNSGQFIKLCKQIVNIK